MTSIMAHAAASAAQRLSSNAFFGTYPDFLVQSELDERIGLLSPVDQWLQEYSHKFLPIEVRVVYYLFP